MEDLQTLIAVAVCLTVYPVWLWRMSRAGKIFPALKAMGVLLIAVATGALWLVGILVAVVVSFLFPHFALFVGLMFCLWTWGEAARERSERRQNAEFHKHWGYD